MKKMEVELSDKMQEVFSQVQFKKRNFSQRMTELKKLYQTTDDKVFAEAFIPCLVVVLGHGRRDPKVENVLHFAAKFAIGVYPSTDETNEEELSPFLNMLFDFLLSNHDVEDAALRFGICHFTNMLLNSMGGNAFLDDTLCDRITTNMMERLLDKVPKVRAQAIFALHRLQDPNDEHCPVIKAFIFHLSKDPNAEVRRAVLVTMAKNKQTLAAVLTRTRDVNVGVRKLAYQFLTKITVTSLKIEQRVQLLSDGLRDRFEKVSNYVKTQLLPTWLDHYKGNFIELLEALDAEKALDLSISMLRVLFETAVLINVVEQVPVNHDTKLIPFDKLSCESSLYWRCTVEHLQREGFQEKVEKLLPDLSKFCRYIREFMKFMKEDTRETWEHQTLMFVLVQLFEITKTYDLSDEFGRERLKELILDVLKSDCDSKMLIDCVVRQLEAIVPDMETRLNLLADVISELRMPLAIESAPMSEVEHHARDTKKAQLRVELLQAKEELHDAVKDKDFAKFSELDKKILALQRLIDDPIVEPVVQDVEEGNVTKDDKETLVKCLQIMFSMMQSVKNLCPLLRTLFEDMVLPSLDHPALAVTLLALKATTVCCLLNENLAKKYLPVFFLQFSVENHDIWLVTLKGIFDLLQLYGLERFGMVPSSVTNDSDRQTCKNGKRKAVGQFGHSNLSRSSCHNSDKDIIDILTGLLDDSNQDMRTIAAEGLCKLLLHRRISSAPLLSRLIISWHNPVTNEDMYLRQCLSYFFNHFATFVPDSQEMMERSFFLTLKMLSNAPDASPLQQIEPLKVAQHILHLTRPGVHNRPLAYFPHDNLAMAIIAEALNTDRDIDFGVLIRSVRYLELTTRTEDDSTQKCLREAVEKLLSKADTLDKRTLDSILLFKSRL